LVKSLDTYSVAFIRYFLASVILLTILRVKHGQFFNKLQFQQHWKLLLSIGVIGIGLYNIAFFGAEKYLSADQVVLIYSFSPCLTALLASWVMKQRLGVIAYLGMIIALCGTVGVINYANPQCGEYFCKDIIRHLSIGEVYALSLCIFAAIFSILNRIASQQHIDSLTITTYAAVFGSVVLLIAMLLGGHPHDILHQSHQFWLALLYTSVIGSVAAYFWFSEAIKDLGVPKVVVFLNGIPFATILLGVVFFNEPISLPIIVCGIVIIAGVMLTNYMINARNK
jgi:drug/metabolite transporter (DMT)-like permease